MLPKIKQEGLIIIPACYPTGEQQALFLKKKARALIAIIKNIHPFLLLNLSNEIINFIGSEEVISGTTHSDLFCLSLTRLAQK